jgi:CheY-like chemotaxis protein
MTQHHRVAFLGFSEFERRTLASYFRLAATRTPHYALVQMLNDADYLVADADHAPSVALVLATDRLAETVFIGVQPPPGSIAWMTRPIDALHVMRELDAMVAQSQGEPAPDPAAPAPEPPTLTEESSVVLWAMRSESPPADAPPLQLDLLPEPRPVLESAPPASAVAAPRAARKAPAAAPARSATQALQAPASAPPPSAPPPPRPAPAAPPAAPTPAAAAAPAVPRALLVDDSEIALRFLESRLQRFSMQIDCALASGPALALLDSRPYDFVFLDVELGPASELDGLALCQHIKRSAAGVTTSVILVSAHHTELDRVRGSLAGCDAYLGKPLNVGELELLMQRHGVFAGKRVRQRAPRPSVQGD